MNNDTVPAHRPRLVIGLAVAAFVACVGVVALTIGLGQSDAGTVGNSTYEVGQYGDAGAQNALERFGDVLP
ncbi:MAG: hypothetical protein ACT4QG_05900 [Sporichthyaceae bacterium]